MQGNRVSKANTIQIRVNRYKNTRFDSVKYKKFDFNNNLKSTHLKELEFTNYVKSKNCKKYVKLRDICKSIILSKSELEILFEADELDDKTSVLKYERMLKIISAINNMKVSKEEVILKFKNRDDKEIQFYIKNENGIFKLYMIDMYHIAIEATNKKTGRADRKGIYRARCFYEYDIKEIQKELNI